MKVNSKIKESISSNDLDNASTLQIIFSARFLMTLLLMFCVFCQFAGKIDISINIVCMINHTAVNMNKTFNHSCPGFNSTGKDGPFIWSKGIQSNILAAFFYGYIISQIPGGLLASKYGSKKVLAVLMLLNIIGSLHLASAARSSHVWLFVLRIIIGIGCGGILPAISHVWTTWAPTNERSFLIGIAMTGSQLAPMIILPIAGYLCTNGFHPDGWPSLFYLIGILETVWLILWLIIYRDKPENSWIISNKEIGYIKAKMLDHKHAKSAKIPWKNMLTSRRCWALFVCHWGSNYGLFTLLTETPSYMKSVLNYDIKQNGVLTAIPYIVTWIMVIISSYLADYVLKKNIVKSRTLVRKVAISISLFIPAAFLIGLGYITCNNRTIAVVLLSFAQGAMGFGWGAGLVCNPNDLSPYYAGTLFGISNTMATIPGIVSPYIASSLTANNPDGWKNVFGVTAAIMIFGGLVFIIFGSAKPERWNYSAIGNDEHEISDFH